MPRSPQRRRSPGARKPPPAEPPSPADGGRGFTTREVAEVLGLPASRILAWTRSGLLTPQRGPRGAYLYSFQDIVLLRAARELLDAEIAPRRVRAAFAALREQLPAGRPLSAVQVSASGDQVLVRDEDRVWVADSGQLEIDLPAPMSRESAPAPDPALPLREPTSAPSSAETHVRSADDWYDAGLDLEAASVPDAMAAYRRALEVDPAHPDAHLNLGRLLHELGEYAEAEAHYREAAAAEPEGARAHYNLGVVLEDQGRPAQAIAAYRSAICLDEDLATAHFNLALLYEARGEDAEALGHLAAYKRLLVRADTGT